MRLLSIGHSSRAIDELLALLRAHGVKRLADVRAFPSSKRHPQFARDALAAALEDAGIHYRWLGEELGGYRKRTRADSPHTALTSFRSYADHMETEAFREGIRRLLALAGEAPTAFLCAERDWRACHRRMISDHLVALKGAEVAHVLDAATVERHRLDPRVRVEEGPPPHLVYDRGMQRELF